MTTESTETRLKRLRMRSWRRGTKEMDMILGPFADAYLLGLSGGALDIYERLLEENDQDLYAWVSGQIPAPPVYAALLKQAGDHARDKSR